MNSKKRCLLCKKYFNYELMIKANVGNFCCVDCQVNYGIKNFSKLAEKAKKQRERKQKVERKEKKEKLKSKQDHLREAQKVFNQFIRLRDEKEPCISCGRFHNGQYHAGHYRTVKAAPSLRFNEDNCHKQCAPCNNHLSGNQVQYRINLIKKIGIGMVDVLENSNGEFKPTIEEINSIKEEYKAKIKELKQNGIEEIKIEFKTTES